MAGSRRPALLAVDGGGSKIDAALVTRAGRILGAARVMSADHDGPGSESHLAGVVEAARAACDAAGVPSGKRPVADLGVYCLAGADLPADDRRISRWIRAAGLTESDVVRNDTFAVLRAGTERNWGVAVVCGFGTNCSAVAPDGRMFRFPAVGAISGDWGGGMDVGGAALWYAVRAEDGRGDRTALERMVPVHFGLRRPRQVMERMYVGTLDAARVVELPPVVFQAARRGDAVARSIADRQADEVVSMATTAIKRLRMTALDVDVVLGGGIFRNDDVEFFGRIDRGLREVAPRATVHRLAAPPVVGAALIGLDEMGASRAAAAAARTALSHDFLLARARPWQRTDGATVANGQRRRTDTRRGGLDGEDRP